MADTKDKASEAAGVATEKQNEKLEHSDKDAPETTRSDLHDLGVPMLQGSPAEPQGPEDALGRGDKRGDYRQRIGPENYQPHQGEVIPEDEREEGGPTTRLVPQRPRAEDIGDDEGKKGGVDTDPLSV